MQVQKLNLFVVRNCEHSLVLLLELIKSLLRALLLLSVRSTASKHLVKESHNDFLSFNNTIGGIFRGISFVVEVCEDDTTSRQQRNMFTVIFRSRVYRRECVWCRGAAYHCALRRAAPVATQSRRELRPGCCRDVSSRLQSRADAHAFPEEIHP